MADCASVFFHAKESRLFRFLAAGGTATLVHWLAMALLIGAGVAAPSATAAGATLGLLVNYRVQHGWAFRSRLRHRTALPRYLSASGLGWLANLGLFGFLHHQVGTLVAQACATALVTLFNFLTSKRFVFHEQG